ncbi:hypothetical protein [Granulosicoccus antarcticus]|uniref:Uncharacterized protein n=1 Tax=Granulosicoccus antarcticus IMCC3135 TaxID=1192854 RepID=A0A2Z2NJL7_9GAMM|nr:hypothetical protein [Granulosicoccus antarcticus]ASJ70695.1 hypothetical protein IMCC3135_02910 [Granulosicoccus antarcticus IMCC3135]
MNNATATSDKHPKLQEVNNARISHGLDPVDNLPSNWKFTLAPFLTLQDLAGGAGNVMKIVREQKQQLEGLA